MTKFNLQDLPLCGAKTRSGKPCKRYGNKANGRCKLHGGRSTGAKTKEGKLKVRLNPLLSSFTWFIDNHFKLKITKQQAESAITAYINLAKLSDSHQKSAYTDAMAIVAEFRVELETLKYYIAEYENVDALMLIQSALDQYYKDIGSKHLYFHVHTPVYPTPFFNQCLLSNAQHQQHLNWDASSLRKKGMFYTGKVKQSDNMRELKKRIKTLQALAE
ncbi:HGGxSTG domain-containing protein [Shewanella sp. HL-SH5]|uniref:HGGxSTG domain-containing protein n=1 Tax=Shewanella sp. HL-SH5 TaxID=3436241 RepID=UPI003EBD992D